MSVAACETWIWGNRLQAATQAAMDLLQGGEISKSSKTGEEWLDTLNKTLGDTTTVIEGLLDNLPPAQ